MHTHILKAGQSASQKKRTRLIIASTAATLFTICSATASANKPVQLTNQQLDSVSAGAVSVQVRALSRGSNSSANVTVKSTADTDGSYTLETAIGVGQAIACCNGGKTNVEINRNGAAIKTGGGSVTSTIRILNLGSYSFGIGVQIGLSAN